MKLLLVLFAAFLFSCNNSSSINNTSATPATDTIAPTDDSTTRININGMPADVPIADSVTNK